MSTITKSQAWTAYKQACDERHNHIHQERCETCWAARNADCPQWKTLTADINATLDRWLSL